MNRLSILQNIYIFFVLAMYYCWCSLPLSKIKFGILILKTRKECGRSHYIQCIILYIEQMFYFAQFWQIELLLFWLYCIQVSDQQYLRAIAELLFQPGNWLSRERAPAPWPKSCGFTPDRPAHVVQHKKFTLKISNNKAWCGWLPTIYPVVAFASQLLSKPVLLEHKKKHNLVETRWHWRVWT